MNLIHSQCTLSLNTQFKNIRMISLRRSHLLLRFLIFLSQFIYLCEVTPLHGRSYRRAGQVKEVT